MKRISSNLIYILISALAILQINQLKSQSSSNYKSINYKDSVLHSYNFITLAEADRILGKSSRLLDSSFKFSSGLLRYKINYVASYKDSTSKGRIFFMFEQYIDTITTKTIYNSLKIENEKTAKVSMVNNLGGDESFLAKDSFDYPFILIRKGNKLFKFKLYYLDGKVSLEELTKVAKKIAVSY